MSWSSLKADLEMNYLNIKSKFWVRLFFLLVTFEEAFDISLLNNLFIYFLNLFIC